ncbi:arginase family protein [Leifsonia bigeumensis]|uniref:Arginase family protein n=1 Tax=Leifsonella bigeumensis TaxID=433643 RepID=A0ABP7FJV2_9MICO
MVSTTFLVVPQWQGSGSARALQLQDGAEAIRGDLPASRTVVVDVPLGAGEGLGSGVRRLSSVQVVRDRTAETLAALSDSTDPDVSPADLIVTIGGDCGVDLAPIERAHAAHPDDLAVVWLDAHADLNTPENSPSGAFHGMVLRTLAGDGLPSFVPDAPVPPSRIVLAGTRALDEPEAEWIAERGIRMLPPSELTPDALVAAIEATGASAVYLHLDLDVLDPGEFTSLGHPEPFGVTVAALLDAIRVVTARFELAGAAICEFAPSTPEAASDDLPTILRIIGALTA